MGNNASVRQFKTDMLDLVNRAKQDFRKTLLLQADEVIGNMQRAIPHQVTGHLSQSLRKKDVSSSDGTKLSVLVIGGGRLTTKRTAGGGSFDYAIAEEFGTVKEEPRPFFYSTFRLYKQQGLERFRETLEETIKENNQVRAARAQSYSNSGVTVSVGHRGSITIHN